MENKYRLTAFLVLAALWAVPAAAFSVGYRVITVKSPQGPIKVAVWYPTDAPRRPVKYGTPGVPGRAAADAPVKEGPWPLVVFAHGYSGSGIGSATIAEEAAARGYIWAAPDFTDEVVEARIEGAVTGDIREALRQLGEKPPSLENHGYRIDQARAVLDAVLADPGLRADPTKVFLAGHSLGGWTVVNLALGDARPRGLVLYSMGELNYLFKNKRIVDGKDLARLKLPVFYTYGSRERLALKGRRPNSLYSFEHTPSPACVAEVRGGGHFVYIDQKAAERAGGNPEQLRRIADATAVFLDRQTRGLDIPVPGARCK